MVNNYKCIEMLTGEISTYKCNFINIDEYNYLKERSHRSDVFRKYG